MAGTKTKVTSLNKVMNDFTHVYFLQSGSDYSSPDFEFPVIEGSINYNTGEIDYSYVKLCTGAVWAAKKTKGDPDISFNVACNNAEIVKLFGAVGTGDEGVSVTLPDQTVATTGTRVNLSSMKVAKGTVIFTDDSGHAEIITGCELTAARGKDEVAYWNVKVTPTSESTLIIV